MRIWNAGWLADQLASWLGEWNKEGIPFKKQDNLQEREKAAKRLGTHSGNAPAWVHTAHLHVKQRERDVMREGWNEENEWDKSMCVCARALTCVCISVCFCLSMWVSYCSWQHEPMWAHTDVFEPDKAWWMSGDLRLFLNHKEMVNEGTLAIAVLRIHTPRLSQPAKPA